ncbi:hypothetical protein [Altericroceibacterium spongiae]|uniref:hypothetical protein n=1 Tax=Altericroceibacterium spongiae TaxID=2320269 RepID=UPI0011C48729|nr:hypothetical protein [Altericroceibacterium spongiae]
MVAPQSAVLSTHMAARDGSERTELVRHNRLPRILACGSCPFRVDARLVTRRLQRDERGDHIGAEGLWRRAEARRTASRRSRRL